MSVFPEAQDDVLKCVVLPTMQRYSVYCHKEVKKPKKYSHLRSWNQRSWTFYSKIAQTDKLIIKIGGD